MGYLSGYETHIVCWRKDLLITMYILRAIVVSSHTIRVDMTREPGDARRSRSDSSESITYELKRSSELSDATLQSRTPQCGHTAVHQQCAGPNSGRKWDGQRANFGSWLRMLLSRLILVPVSVGNLSWRRCCRSASV